MCHLSATRVVLRIVLGNSSGDWLLLSLLPQTYVHLYQAAGLSTDSSFVPLNRRTCPFDVGVADIEQS